MPTLRDRVTADRLERLAGSLIFDRGRRYVADGRVGAIRAMPSGQGIEATIRGSSSYLTRLLLRRGGLVAECTCPMGADGEFCKHAVALGLAWLEWPEDPEASHAPDAATDPAIVGPGPNATAPRPDPFVSLDEFDRDLADIRAHLRSQPPDALVDLLMARAVEDPRLLRRLLVDARTARPAHDALAVRAVKSEIDAATRGRGFIRYRNVPPAVERARDATDLIDRFVDAERFDEAIALNEYAIGRVEAMLGKVDDSDGLVGDLLGELQEQHLELCRLAPPDPRALAKRIFAWEMRSEWDVFAGAVERYADVLGPDGIAEYRRLAEARWSHVEPLGRGDPSGVMDGPRFRITLAMESLGRALGDIDGLIAVQSADLSNPYRYVEVSKTCLDHGRREEAIQWALAGIEAWPEATDPRIHDFLADRYEEDGRTDDALELTWRTYLADARQNRYANLRARALRLGVWPAWRERALSRLREEAEAASAQASVTASAPSSGRPVSRGHLVALPSIASDPLPAPPAGIRLVEILLWEREYEAAWSAARQFGCTEFQWQQLARAALDSHPYDAIPILQHEVQGVLQRSIPENYPKAVELIERIGRALVSTGRPAAYATYLADLRARHGRKRKFVGLLDRIARR